MRNYDAILSQLLKEQNNCCWNCGRRITRDNCHAHHGVIPKGHSCYRKFKQWMDMRENIALVCPECDTQHGKMTGFEKRNELFSQKIDLGYDMFGWLKSMNMIIQENFHYVSPDKRRLTNNRKGI